MKKMSNCDDGFNYCGLHKDGKGLNFYIYDEEGQGQYGIQDSIFIRTEQLEDGTYKTHLEVTEGQGSYQGNVNLNLYSEVPLNLEGLYADLEDNYEKGSERHYQEVFENHFPFIMIDKVEGTLTNTDSFIELRECKDINLVEKENFDYNKYGNDYIVHIKNENENTFESGSQTLDEYFGKKETLLPDGKFIYEYEEDANRKNEINKMKIEIKGSQIKFNDMTPEEMVKKGDFGNKIKYNIKSSKELDKVLKNFFTNLECPAYYDKLPTNKKMKEKIIKKFEKNFEKIKTQMEKNEEKNIKNSQVR